jgi:NADH-quinone oxidoreductase subunit G
MDVDLFVQTTAAAAGQLAALGVRTPAGGRVAARDTVVASPGAGQAVLATWRRLLDDSTLAMDEPHLAGTARAAQLLCNSETAAGLGLTEGAPGSVATDRGAITLPVALADLPDGVVWVPGHSPGSPVRATLGAGHGALVTVSAGGEQ